MNENPWEKGKDNEVAFWTQWFNTKGLDWGKDYANRLDANLPFQDYLVKYLPKPPKCSILDVGAGPLTLLGKVLTGYELAIVAIDPLADEYNSILERNNISPIIRTQQCEVERLSERFSPEYFDLVHVQNALDHSYDPLEGITQMLRVLRQGCFIFMAHITNEAEKENYVGFHQWNFCQQDGKFIIWNKHERIDVREVLKKEAQVSIHGDAQWNVVEIRKL